MPLPRMAEVSSSHGEDYQQELPPDELQLENQLLEQYLRQKGAELPPDSDALPLHQQHANKASAGSTPLDLKLQIAIEALSQLNNTLEARKETAHKLVTTLKVMLGETELRISDLQRDAHDLRRDVVEGGMCRHNPERYKAEKVVRYMDGRLLDQESALDKLRLKNSTLSNRKKKLEAQLSREEETSFHHIDYHQKQIKLKQNKNDLKSIASKVSLRNMSFEKSKQRVDALQAQLHDIKAKAHANEKAVALREAYLERLDEQVYAKEDELDGLKNALGNKKDPSQVLEDELTGPDVMEYIMQKAEIFELRETIKAMERKVELARGRRKLERRREPSRQPVVEKKRPSRWTPGML